MPCEDYPCCGHEPGDCPRIDEQGREHWRCVECGYELPLNATSSICSECLPKLQARWRAEDGFDIEEQEEQECESCGEVYWASDLCNGICPDCREQPDDEFYLEHDHSMDY